MRSGQACGFRAAAFGSLILAAAIAALSARPAHSNPRCYPGPESPLILIDGPTDPLTFLFSFEDAVRLAFPVGSPEARLKEWLRSVKFMRYGRSDMDSTFVVEPDEISCMSARFKSGQTVWLMARSWSSFCGGMHFSVASSADSCGRLTEVWPDTELCQVDLP